MRIRDELVFMRKSGGGASPVMDGLYIWIDGQDPLVTCSTESVSLLNRATGTSIECDNPSIYGRPDWYSFTNENNFLKLSPIYLWTNKRYGRFDGVYGTTIPNTFEFSGYTESPHTINFACLDNGYGGVQIKKNEWTRAYHNEADGWHIVNGTFAENTSHHYVLTTDGTTKKKCKMYMDGLLVDEGVILNYYSTDTPFLRITTENATYNSLYIGTSRCYNRALSEAEVQQNYEYEKSLGRVE